MVEVSERIARVIDDTLRDVGVPANSLVWSHIGGCSNVALKAAARIEADILTSLEKVKEERDRLRETVEAFLLYADPSGDGIYDGARDIAGEMRNGELVLKGSFITTCIRARAALTTREGE